MKWTRGFIVFAAGLSAALSLVGCGAAPDATGPRTTIGDRSNPPSTLPSKPASMVALSALTQPGWAGFSTASSPAVKILNRDGIPVPNVIVSFTVTRGEGTMGKAEVVTDQSGFASTSWVLGAQGGSNTVAASVPGLQAVSFEASATVPVIVARYDLTEIGGAALPLGYVTGDAPWVVTAGHYLLAADNTFAFGYEINGISHVVPTGAVVRVDATTIQFILSANSYPASRFYQARNGLFATGHIDGKVMTVNYEDFVDFDIERYVLSGG